MIAPVIRLRSCLPNDLDACLGIVRGLPEFFTADALDTIRSDLGQHEVWAADDDEVVGFAIVDRRSSTTAEILWAAVHRDRRGYWRRHALDRACSRRAGRDRRHPRGSKDSGLLGRLWPLRVNESVLGAQGLCANRPDRPDARLAVR